MTAGQALLDEINRQHGAPGTVTFWWLGQMSFVVKAGKSVLYFDPYLAPDERRQVPPMLDASAITNADFVFGSHDHGDHIDPVAIKGIAAASPQARFVCSRVAAKTVLFAGCERRSYRRHGRRRRLRAR